MFCKNCGKQIDCGNNFCPHCGACNREEIEEKVVSEENHRGKKNFAVMRVASATIVVLAAIVIIVVIAIGNKTADLEENEYLAMQDAETLPTDEDNYEAPENDLDISQNEYDYVGEYIDGIAVASSYGYYGFIDDTGNELTEFIYEQAENFVDGLALVKKDGYYGYIDKTGETAIGFMYDEATSFDKEYGLAIVKSGNGKGVIDKNGTVIVNTQYDDIYFESGFIITAESDDLKQRGVFSTNGYQIIRNDYDEFYFTDDKIYATNSRTLGDVYDYDGNNLLDSEELSGALEISPPINGVSIVKFEYDFTYTNVVEQYETVDYYLYYDTNLKPLIDTKLSWTTDFNKLGYAIARYSAINDLDNVDIDDAVYSGWQGHDYAIIKSDGTEVQRLPEPEFMEEYINVNDYYVLMRDTEGSGCDIMLERNFLDKIFYGNLEMVDGTNCIIVKNENSGLYGMFDGLTMKKDGLYNEISYDEESGVFTLTRGAEIEEYVPQY